ncbi:MAG: 3'-5' exonuclease, partial [Candidatus Adiutrix sp.]
KAVSDFYYGRVKDLYPDDWPERQSDLREIVRMAESRQGLNSFLADMTLDPPNHKQHDSGETQGPTLTLSTIHSAKGLEWQAVFLLSAVEGRFPPAYGARTKAEVEEELRLMYVAVTRAEDRLFIMLPLGEVDRRTGFGGRPSRFLAALPENCGLKLWQNGHEVEQGELLSPSYDFEMGNYGSGDFFKAKGPVGAPSSLYIHPPPLSHPKDNSPPLMALAGQRVVHPVYGAGLVLAAEEGQALIDFDHFGKKKVVMQYARLTVC